MQKDSWKEKIGNKCGMSVRRFPANNVENRLKLKRLEERRFIVQKNAGNNGQGSIPHYISMSVYSVEKNLKTGTNSRASAAMIAISGIDSGVKKMQKKFSICFFQGRKCRKFPMDEGFAFRLSFPPLIEKRALKNMRFFFNF